MLSIGMVMVYHITIYVCQGYTDFTSMCLSVWLCTPLTAYASIGMAPESTGVQLPW